MTRIKRHQEGAVWVEFLVAASTVLLSLFFLIPMMEKYIDIRHSTEKAARYSAWERTVWHGSVGEYGSSSKRNKTSSDIENEVNHRILGSGGSLIYNAQGSTGELSNLQLDPFLAYNNLSTSNYEKLLVESGSGTNKYLVLTKDNESVVPGGTSALNSGLDAFGVILDGGVPVERKGYYTEEVSIEAKVPTWIKEFDVFANGKIGFTSSNSILVDGWEAGGIEDNKKKVRAMKPIGGEAALNATVRLLKGGYGFYRKFAKEPWMIEVEKVDGEQLLEGENPANLASHLGVY